MIKFNKKIRFLLYSICFLIIFNIALLYEIPLLLPISAMIILCIIPGFLLCLLFKIRVTDIYENFLYSFGLSIIFDLILALLINTLLPVLGFNEPLSTQNLQITFSTIILFLTLLIFYTDNVPSFSFKMTKIFRIEKIILIFGFMIITFFFIGIYFLNVNNTQFFIIFSILLFPLLLIFLIVHHNNSFNRIYPVIIYLISFSLLMLLSLRSNYIVGVDTHEEYYFFYTTFSKSIWIPNPSLLLSSALSISLLPVIFEKFLNIDPQLLYKILFPLIYSVTPLIIYVITKKYVDELFALICSCFFMFQQFFIQTTANSRTAIAVFFFALAVLVICNKELSNIKKYVMLLLFITGSVFSHYTSSLFFLVIISSVYFMDLIISKYKNREEDTIINLPLIIFFFTLMYFWYQQINNLLPTITTLPIFRFIFSLEMFPISISELNYDPYTLHSFFQKFLSVYPRLASYALIGIGILYTTYRWMRQENKKNSIPKFTMKIDRTFFFMGFVAFGILVCSVFAGFLFLGYDTNRIWNLLCVVLPVFLIVGTCIIFNLILLGGNLFFSKTKFYKKIQPLIQYCKSNQIKIVSGIILLLLIPQLLTVTEITTQFWGPYSVVLNSPKSSTNFNDYPDKFYYILDQDASSLNWFKDNSYKNSSILSDFYGQKKITSVLPQTSIVYQIDLLESNEDAILKGFIFIPVIDRNYGRFFTSHLNNITISSYNHIFNQKNKIFSNGAVIYK